MTRPPDAPRIGPATDYRVPLVNGVPQRASEGASVVTFGIHASYLPAKKTLRRINGEVTCAPIEPAARSYFYSAEVSGIRALLADLHYMEKHSSFNDRAYLVRGAFASRTPRPHRRISCPRDKERVLYDVPSHLLALDLDGVAVPVWIDPTSKSAIKYLLRRLPDWLARATVIVHWSSRAGLDPTEIRAHLFFWLDRPLTGAQLTTLVKAAGIECDDSVFRPGQPLFFLPPKFVGMHDPVPERWHLAEGETDVAVVPAELIPSRKTPKSKESRPNLGEPGAPQELPKHLPPQEALINRSRTILAHESPAVQGQGGRKRLFTVAMKLVRGLCLAPDKAIELIIEDFNPRCEPPFSENEVESAVHGAFSRGRLKFGALI